MDLSIVIPIYNTELNKLERCINSIVELEEIDYELILVNDGSDENKSKGYKAFSKKHSKIVYVEKTNGGVSSARNEGIRISRGDYIMFVDSDDAIIAKNFKKTFFKYGFDIIIFDKYYIKNNNRNQYIEFDVKEGIVDNRYVLQEFAKNNKFHSPWGKIIRKEFLYINNIFFDNTLIQGEDAIFNYNMLNCNPRIYYINTPIYEYYYDFNTSNNRWKKNPDKMLESAIKVYNCKYSCIKNFENKREYDEIIEKINTNAINNFFRIVMNLCEDRKRNLERLNKASEYIKSIVISKKYTLKYKLIVYKRWYIITCFSKMRKIHMKQLKYK